MREPHKTRSNRRLRAGIVATSLGVLLLSGCGFHLRGLDDGSGPMMKDLQLTIANDTPQNQIARQLRNSFLSAGVQLNDTANLELNIGAANYTEMEVGFNGNGGDGGSQEREVILNVPYSVQRASDHAYLADQQFVEVRGTFHTSTNQLLQRDNLRSQLQQQLAQEAAEQMLERVRAISVSTNAQGGTATAPASSSAKPQPPQTQQ